MLVTACSCGDRLLIQNLISNGVPPDFVHAEQQITPLIAAARMVTETSYRHCAYHCGGTVYGCHCGCTVYGCHCGCPSMGVTVVAPFMGVTVVAPSMGVTVVAPSMGAAVVHRLWVPLWCTVYGCHCGCLVGVNMVALSMPVHTLHYFQSLIKALVNQTVLTCSGIANRAALIVHAAGSCTDRTECARCRATWER